MLRAVLWAARLVLDDDLDGLAGGFGDDLRQGFCHMGATTRIIPPLTVEAIMKAAAGGCHPHFLHGCLAVDDDMDRVVEDKGQYVTTADRLDVEVM